MEIDDEDSLLEVEETPGVRFKRLRNELQDQIANRKSVIWQNKSAKPGEKLSKEEGNDDNTKDDYEPDVDDILDNEDEEEMSESSEEEEIEDDEETTKQEKKKSAFIDEEAEESDVEDEENDRIEDNEEKIEEDEKNDSDKENEDVGGTDVDENSESTNLSEKETSAASVRKPLRRILKGFTEDSDDDEDIKTKPTVDKRVNEDDDMITPHQIPNSKTPNKETSVESQNSFGIDFLTPVSFITGIKNLTNSAAKVKVDKIC